MGNCSCLRENYSQQEQEQLNNITFNGENQILISTIKDLKKHEIQIIKIQALIRSYITRKRIYKTWHEKYNLKVNEQLQAYSSTLLNFNQKITSPFYFGTDDLDESIQAKKTFKGCVTLDSGAIYFGEWVNNKRHGKGIITWPDGSKFEGYFKDNKANNRGRLVHANGEIYEGDWVDDVAQGYGIYTHLDGTTYEGQWEKDMQHGKGIEKWADGSTYEGDFAFGKKHGKGKFMWVDGSFYTGDLWENNLHGIGKYQWADEKYYFGEWTMSKKECYGTFIWPDGRKYEGQFQDDSKHGFGILTYDDGRKYIGQWKNDKQEGIGKIILSNGVEKTGVWKEGKKMKNLESSKESELLLMEKQFNDEWEKKKEIIKKDLNHNIENLHFIHRKSVPNSARGIQNKSRKVQKNNNNTGGIQTMNSQINYFQNIVQHI